MLSKLKSKNKLLILALLPMLLSLTGCNAGSPKHATFHLTGNWGAWIDYSIWCIGAGITYTFDKFAAGLKSLGISTIQTVVVEQNTGSIATLLGYNESITTLMNVVSALTCAIILIKFAHSIFKYNFQATDNQYAPTAIELIKKVLVAIVVTFAIPYICVTGFTLSSKLGSAAATQLTQSGENALDVRNYQIFNYMEDHQISYTTVCKTDESKKPDDYIDNKDLSTAEATTGFSGSGDRSFWCGEANSVGDHFMNDKLDSKLAAVITSNTTSYIAEEDDTQFMTYIAGLLGLLFYVALTVIVGWSIAKRIVDLIVLIGMSWWYIGSSVSDGATNVSLSALWKKLLSICLSQFFLLFELGLLQSFNIISGVGDGLNGVIRAIAWLTVLTGTPTIVEGMTTSTGAGSDLSAVGSAAGKGLKSMLSQFKG